MRIERALLSVNFRAGRRSSLPIDTIVIHVTEGDIASVKSWFNNPKAEVSAHYCVTRTGTIIQFVEEENTAWHAGRVLRATAAIVKERLPANPNGYSIGIEHEGNGHEDLTDAQREASAWLVRDIATRREIPLGRRHVIGHREIYAAKTCPGAIDIDRLLAAAGAAGVAAPRVVYSPSLQEYLVVTRYASDSDWSFVRASKLPKGTKAGSALSAMPLHP